VCQPIEAWPVLLKDHHEGYITWEAYVHNQQRVANNRTNTQPLPSAARDGLALLQGLLLCGRCARHVTIRYTGNGGVYPSYECNRAKMDGVSTTHCLSVRSPEIDAAVSQRVLEVFQPAQLAIALQAYEELAQRATTIDRQWQLKIERAEYEAHLAQRRYEEVDPANRLVAATLEQRWNSALEQVDAVKQAYTTHQHAQGAQDLVSHREAVLALGQDLPRLWNAPTTSAKDRKRMLRLVLKDITITKATKAVTLQIRWHGGATCQKRRRALDRRPRSPPCKSGSVRVYRTFFWDVPGANLVWGGRLGVKITSGAPKRRLEGVGGSAGDALKYESLIFNDPVNKL
jgi:hypothetical protein